MFIGERIKQLRIMHGLSQTEFANKVGLSQSAVGMYETGRRNPKYEILETVADFFNVDMNYLLGIEDESTYVITPEIGKYIAPLRDRSELRTLLDCAMKADSHSVETAIMFLEAVLKNKE